LVLLLLPPLLLWLLPLRLLLLPPLLLWLLPLLLRLLPPLLLWLLPLRLLPPLLLLPRGLLHPLLVRPLPPRGRPTPPLAVPTLRTIPSLVALAVLTVLVTANKIYPLHGYTAAVPTIAPKKGQPLSLRPM
jgi:hypothetical protein